MEPMEAVAPSPVKPDIPEKGQSVWDKYNRTFFCTLILFTHRDNQTAQEGLFEFFFFFFAQHAVYTVF